MARVTLEWAALRAFEHKIGFQIHRHKKDVLKEMERHRPFRLDDWNSNWDEEELLTRTEALGYYRESINDLFRERIIPDGWIFIPGNAASWNSNSAHDGIARIVAVEVEDTNPLSMDKLLSYGHMFWAFDDEDDIDLELVAIDRYGQNPKWFDVCSLGYLSIMANIDRDPLGVSVIRDPPLFHPKSPLFKKASLATRMSL